MSTTEHREILQSTYYNPKTGFVGAGPLHKKVVKEDPSITLRETKDWLNSQSVQQEFKQTKPGPSFHIRQKVDYPFSRCQIDLLEMGNEPGKNHGYKYVFVAIDCYTRYVLTANLKNKTTTDCMKGLNMLIKFAKDNKVKINQIDMDQERSFMSEIFQKRLDSEEIIANYSTDVNDKKSQGFVERMNRTIREKYAKYKQSFKKYDWIRVIPLLILNYNNTIHSATKQTPVESLLQFTDRPFESLQRHAQIYETQDNQVATPTLGGPTLGGLKAPPEQASIAVGDRVRLRLQRSLFDKSSNLTNFTTTIHTVILQKQNQFQVTDRQKYYKTSDLQKVNKSETNPYVQNDNEISLASERLLDSHAKAQRIEKTLAREGLYDSTAVRPYRDRRSREIAY